MALRRRLLSLSELDSLLEDLSSLRGSFLGSGTYLSPIRGSIVCSGPRGGDGDGDLERDRERLSVRRLRIVDSLITTVFLPLKGFRPKETLRLRGGGDGLGIRGFLSMIIGSGEGLLSEYLRLCPDMHQEECCLRRFDVDVVAALNSNLSRSRGEKVMER